MPNFTVPPPFLSGTLLFLGVLPCALGTFPLVPRHHPSQSLARFHTPSRGFFFLVATILRASARFSFLGASLAPSFSLLGTIPHAPWHYPSRSSALSLALLGRSSVSFVGHLVCLLQIGAIPRAFLIPSHSALSLFFIAPFAIPIVPTLVYGWRCFILLGVWCKYWCFLSVGCWVFSVDC